MNYKTFIDSLQDSEPPTTLSSALQALWWDKKEAWDKAHDATQPGGLEADWVHAYLHRKEGDQGNASYWYHKAHKPKPSSSLEQEWEDILQTLLAEE